MRQLRTHELGLLSAGLLLLLSAGTASADILTLHADAKVGGAGGKGMFGAQKDAAFQEGRGAAAYGVVVGGEFFFIDGWIQHDQFLDGGSVSGTWTQFMLGLDVEVGMGAKKGFDFDPEGNEVGGYESWMLELGMGAGFGVGTGQQVDPPLDNSEVTDKGFLFEARGMLAYRLTKMFALGLTVPVQFGYFTKAGNGAVANDQDQHYSAMGATGMLTLRANWNIK